jgi:iron complex outermembrane recepter protein
VEALPRGSAQRVGGAAGQRAYNVVLRPSVQSATVTVSREFATEGYWENSKGEVLLNYIKGQDRIGLTLRGADSNTLFEANRDVEGRPQSIPFAPLGNIVPFAGGEVDPALSALLGQPVSVVALPNDNSKPTLGSLLPGANQTNPSDLAYYRSLRGAARPYEIALAGNKTLTPNLSLSFNGKLGWLENENFSGLPSARFLIPTTNAFTPFSNPVYLAISDPTRPLRSNSDSTNRSLSGTLNANFALWHGSLVARYDERERTFFSQTTGSLTGGLGTVDAVTNPFGRSLAALIPVNTRRSDSKTSTSQINADVDGPLLDLWAGPLLARIGVGVAWLDLDATDSLGDRSFRRHEYTVKGGLTVPLTSTSAPFLAELGDSEVAVDIGLVDLGRYGTLDQRSIALNWQPLDWLRVVASDVLQEQAVSPELIVAPEVITPNVPYFDPLTGQTVEVTTIYGGGSDRSPEAADANPVANRQSAQEVQSAIERRLLHYRSGQPDWIAAAAKHGRRRGISRPVPEGFLRDAGVGRQPLGEFRPSAHGAAASGGELHHPAGEGRAHSRRPDHGCCRPPDTADAAAGERLSHLPVQEHDGDP